MEPLSESIRVGPEGNYYVGSSIIWLGRDVNVILGRGGPINSVNKWFASLLDSVYRDRFAVHRTVMTSESC